MKRTIDNEQFLKLKEELSNQDAAVKEIPISAISVDEKCLKYGRILVNDQPVSVSPGFFSKLGSLLKMNASLTNQMMKSGDHRIASALINGLKDYAASSREKNVLLVASNSTKEVVDICPPKRYRRVTNDTLFDVTSRIMNDNPNLEIETIDWRPDNGGVSINLLNNQEVGFANAGKDEFFKFGFSIIQTAKDTMVETYNQRLICSNGLRASLGQGAIGGNSQIQFEDRFRLAGSGAEDVRSFLGKIEDMKRAGFVPQGFDQAIQRAVDTKASLGEVEKSFFKAHNMIDELDPQLKQGYQAALARNWFHGYGDTLARVTRKGHDPKMLTDQHKRFIKTSMSIWDVVNSMTFLGSNNSGIPLANQHELKASAGQLFAHGVKDGFDLEFSQFASL